VTARSIALTGALTGALTVALAAIAWPALGTAPAWADRQTSADARAHFRQGQAFFQIGEYDRALAEYQRAFDLSREPSLVFNIALCHERANRPQQALEAFQRYIALAPDGAVADEARESIARLTLIVDRLASEREARRAADEAQQRDEAARRDAAARSAAGQRRQRIAGAIVVSGGVIAVAGGVAHGLAWRTREGLADAPDFDTYAADRDAFRLQRNLAIGGYAVGAVTIAAGLILGRTLLRGDEGPQISAALAPGGATLAVRWWR
jgi:tetratricopeptide (TPR) repeat protein